MDVNVYGNDECAVEETIFISFLFSHVISQQPVHIVTSPCVTSLFAQILLNSIEFSGCTHNSKNKEALIRIEE